MINPFILFTTLQMLEQELI